MSGQDNSSVGPVVQTGWDISSTAYNSFSLLRELIAKVSQDNVHPAAILAAEALGTGMLFADQRILQAKEALGSNQNYRLLETRITIGLHYGNTVRAMQQSTSLLRFFTLIAAFKLVFVNDEIADILYEMLSATKLFAIHPVNPKQFEQLLEQFSGHANAFAPKDEMHNLACAVSNYHPIETLYHRFDAQGVAGLFVAFFEALQDMENTFICLTGHCNGIWIATTILWWLPESSALFVDGTMVRGNEHCRVQIIVLPKIQTPWTIEIWKQTGHPSKFVCYDVPSETNVSTSTRIPLDQLAEFMKVQHLYSQTTSDSEEFWLKTVARVAMSLIFILLRLGKLKYHNRFINLTDLIADEWHSNLPNILCNYGFSASDASTETIDAIVQEINDHLQGKSVSAGTSPTGLIQEVLVDHFTKLFYGPNDRVERYIAVLGPAYHIALDAILTCTVNFKVPRLTTGETLFSWGDAGYTLASFLAGTMEFDRFHSLMLRQILQEDISRTEELLVYGRNGYVLAASMLQRLSVKPNEACAMELSYGTIRYNGSQFVALRERRLSVVPPVLPEHCTEIKLEELLSKAIDGVKLFSPYKPQTHKLQTHVSFTGENVYIKQYLSVHQNDGEVRWLVSWLDAIEGCSVSKYFHEPTTPDLHSSLSKTLQIREKVFWTSPESLPLYMPGNLLVDTHGNDIVKAFAIGTYGVLSKSENRNAVYNYNRSSRSLLPMLSAGEKEIGWIIFL